MYPSALVDVQADVAHVGSMVQGDTGRRGRGAQIAGHGHGLPRESKLKQKMGMCRKMEGS